MRPDYDYVFDTSAWAAFFGADPAGERVMDILATSRVATCVLSLAELSDVYHRGPLGPLFDEDREFVQTASDIVPVLPEVAVRAGVTKVRRRESVPHFGLVDALILETARHHCATLLTTDKDLKGMRDVEWLGR